MGFFLATLLMNLICYPLLVAMTFMGILLFPLLYLITKGVTGWPRDRIIRFLIWIYGRVWIGFMSVFTRFETKGFKEQGLPRPAILVVNHLSYFDTYCMALLPVFDVVFAVRSWPFKLFWYRYFMVSAGYLDVESWPWERIARYTQEIFERRGYVLFFPEGHRSRDGRLQPFYGGAFRLAAKTGVPIVPLCITGTDQLLPPGRFWMKPCRIRLTMLTPIETRQNYGGRGHRQLCRDVHQRIEAALSGHVGP
jgi:1-acyl-sn-glycerol-3-phosphate acyltransferase